LLSAPPRGDKFGRPRETAGIPKRAKFRQQRFQAVATGCPFARQKVPEEGRRVRRGSILFRSGSSLSRIHLSTRFRLIPVDFTMALTVLPERRKLWTSSKSSCALARRSETTRRSFHALLVLHYRCPQPSVKTIAAPHSAAVKRPDCHKPAVVDAGLVRVLPLPSGSSADETGLPPGEPAALPFCAPRAYNPNIQTGRGRQ
jgi:hypothetical protein